MLNKLKTRKSLFYILFCFFTYLTNSKVVQAGLIPCGMKNDDPATTIVENEACNLCHLVLTMQLIIEYLVKISAVFAVLMIVISGFIYISAGGKSETIAKAKTVIKYSLIGFTIVFIAWALVDSLLMTFGYIDPFGGNWHTIC